MYMKKGCAKMEEPLLFIPSPPFYYVEDLSVSKEDESTSIFEMHRTERIQDSVIARQLHYFLQPVNRNKRTLTFHLKSGNSITGKIEDLVGIELVIKTENATATINANEIKTISNSDF